MDKSTPTPVVPRLEMGSLRQADQQQHEQLYKIRQSDAQRFLEESLLLLLANNFKSTANEGDEEEEEDVQDGQMRTAAKRRTEKSNSMASIHQFLLQWAEEEGQQQIQSARSILSGRLSALSDSEFPPKSPRVKNGTGEERGKKMSEGQLMNALVAKSKLILLMASSIRRSVPRRQNPLQMPNSPAAGPSLPFSHMKSIGGGHIQGWKEEEGDGDHRWREQAKRPGNGPDRQGGGQLFATGATQPSALSSVFWPNQQQRQHQQEGWLSMPRNKQIGQGQQLARAEEEEEEEGGGEGWPRWQANGPPSSAVTMGGREGGGGGEAPAGLTLPRPHRSNQPRSNPDQQPTNRLVAADNNGTEPPFWWSSEDEEGRQRRRKWRGGGSVEVAGGGGEGMAQFATFQPPFLRPEALPSHQNPSGQQPLFGGARGPNRFGQGSQGQEPAEGERAAPLASARPSIRGSREQPRPLPGEAVADPKLTHFLLNYAQQGHPSGFPPGQFRPSSPIAEAPFVNRSKTVPLIKFRHRPEEEEEEAKKPITGEEQHLNTLSPVSRSQNLLEAAINSLNGQLHLQRPSNFEAVSVTVAEPGQSRRIGEGGGQSLHPREKDFRNSPSERQQSQPSPEASEELVRLFQELGFDLNRSISKNLSTAFEDIEANEEMAKTTSNWKNSFAAMRERFGGSTDSAEMEETIQSPTTFVTGRAAAGAENWSSTVPRSAANGKNTNSLTKSASGNALPNNAGANGQRVTNPNVAAQPQQQQQQRRPSQQQQGREGNGPSSKELGNFWQQMLKTRQQEASSNAHKLPLGLSAAERLQQLQQEALLEEANRQSPASAASSSAGSSSTPEWGQPGKYPYRRTGGVESVAIRRNNFLAEVQRIESPLLMNFGGESMAGSDSGRTTPLLRVPKPESDQNSGGGHPEGQPKGEAGHFGSQQLNGTSRQQQVPSGQMGHSRASPLAGKQQQKGGGGCGRFPTGPADQLQWELAAHFEGTNGVPRRVARQGQQQHSPGNQPKRKRSPDGMGEASQHSASRPSLPQPAPKHNIRDQLINAGYLVTRQVPSFFGGAANNPFFGGTHQQQIHQQQQQQQQRPMQPMPFRSNSPNFPSTNTVTARISELENKQQQKQPSNGQLKGQWPAPPPAQPQVHLQPSFGADGGTLLSIRTPSSPAATPPNAGQLSPRSTVFRRKPVIFLEEDQNHLGVQPGRAQEGRMAGPVEKQTRNEPREKLANEVEKRPKSVENVAQTQKKPAQKQQQLSNGQKVGP